MVWIGVIAAVITFLFFKNKQENRMIGRRNRILEKQEEIIEMLRKKTETENKENSKDEN
jgi:hypothetical protein